MGERRRRADQVAKRQSVFRDVNERIEEAADGFGPAVEPLLIVCECGRAGCCAMLELRPAEYEELRRSGIRFAVVPGHELPGVELVVATNGRFTTVEKTGAGGRTAAALDPRRREAS